MPTHTWKANASGFILDPANYVEGGVFQAGDTLVISSGSPNAAGQNGAVGTLTAGIYDFIVTSAEVNLQFQSVELGASGTMLVTGPGPLDWTITDQFITAGTLAVGSPAMPGTVSIQLLSSGSAQPAITNSGHMTVQDGSSVTITPFAGSSAGGGLFFNAAGATLAIESGGGFTFSNGTGFVGADVGTVRNDGTIQITGSASVSTGFFLAGQYTGAGALNITGADGASPASTFAEIDGPASGTFNIKSGLLYFANAEAATNPAVAGTVNFLDNDGALRISTGPITPSSGAKDNPFGATITGFRAGDQIDIDQSFSPFATPSYDPATNILTIFGTDISGARTGPIAQLKIVGDYTSSDFTLHPADSFLGSLQDAGSFYLTTAATACYAAGTRIATPTGQVKVERLRTGDAVLTQSADARRIVWIGHRQVECRRHPRPYEVLPVRISAHAFEQDRPRRPLLLSPDHAVFVEGVLIPIRYLINGSSIAQVQRDRVTYYHIELAQHEILLAEGLPAESFVPGGDRSAFANGAHPTRLHPDFHALAWEAGGCAPLIVTGPVLLAVRDRLERRARCLGRPERHAAAKRRAPMSRSLSG